MADMAEIKGLSALLCGQTESAVAQDARAFQSIRPDIARTESVRAFQTMKRMEAEAQGFRMFSTMQSTVQGISGVHAVLSVREGTGSGFELSADTQCRARQDIAVNEDTLACHTASAAVNADTLRGLYAWQDICGDTARATKTVIENPAIDVRLDTYLNVCNKEQHTADTYRQVFNKADVNAFADTERAVSVGGSFEIDADTARALQKHFSLNADTCTSCPFSLHIDTERSMAVCFAVLADTCRRAPFDTTFRLPANRTDTADTFRVPKASQQEGMVSMSITLNELSLSDSFELETTKPVEVLDAIYGTILDFSYSYVIGETEESGSTISASGMYDVDSLLFTPMTYTTASVKHRASWHAERIAGSLGKSLHLAISDFTHSSTWVGAGQTYESIISSLFGWTSSVPRRQINVFMRGNTLNVVQRGHESAVTDITSIHHTRPVFHKEVVRTMWSYKSSDSTAGAHGINIEPVPFTGTISFGDATASYSSGYLTEETVNGDVTTYSYSGAGGTQYVDSKVCVHKDGSITKTEYGFAGTQGGISVLGSETETTTDKNGNVSTVRKTIHAPLGNGFYGTSVYVDDEYMGSSISTGTPSATASRYLISQESLSMGGAHYGKKSDGSNSLIEEASFPVEEGAILKELTREIKWLNRRIKETVTMDIYNYGHVLDFDERIAFKGNEYYLVSNRITKTVRELKQSITMARWY